MSAERRQFGRRTTSLHAWIKVPGRPAMACIVRNLSVTGALLEFDVPHWMPYRFRLIIEATRFESNCETRHMGPHSLGVMFTADKGKSDSNDRPIVTDNDVWAGAATVAKRF